MSWFDVELNAQADSTAGRIATVHLHDGDPGDTGLDNEVSGGSYAPATPTFEAAGAEGPLGATDQPETVGRAWCAPSFSVPADTTLTHYSYRDVTDEVLGTFALPADEYFPDAGTYAPSVGVGPVI